MAFSEQALSQLPLADTFHKIHITKTFFEDNLKKLKPIHLSQLVSQN